MVLFGVLLLFLIATQFISKESILADKQINDPNSKLMTIAKVSQVCIEEPSDVMVCQDIKDTQYNIILVRDDVDNSHHILIKYQRGE
jgi:hypothetical protein